MRPPTAMQMPGAGDLVHARLLGHPDRYDEILTEHLPRLLDPLNTTLVRWWFRRHRDITRPDTLHQLLLYLQLCNSHQYGAVATHLAGFATGLQSAGLLARMDLAAYQPQTGRYGAGVALAAAHEVAACDSGAALAQIVMAARTGLPAQAIAAASMADLAASLAASEEGYGWLINKLDREYGKLGRTSRDATLLLANSADDHQALRDQPGGAAVANAWTARRAALSGYRVQLARHDHQPITVLRSLLHDHHVRALGVDPGTEAVTNRLARAAPRAG
ncbi:thiopeptide-type bacteriocin biosynthesis protein [Nonomuraea fuscirosea]|uniref:thiopeptide-type bacteriocin biosynthesis protein n=1 Tax=Nonomuraea fuscirosea TaxID=1291556 RepID=UPI0033EAA7B8